MLRQFEGSGRLDRINGKTHDGSKSAPVPNVLGMNFQAVSVGEKLVEKSIGATGGYIDSMGTPSKALLGEIQYVDSSIGLMVEALRAQKLLDSTLIIISAKHGQSAIDPKAVLRIPADNSSFQPPSAILGGMGTGLVGGGLVGQALEDDISLIWLTDQTQDCKICRNARCEIRRDRRRRDLLRAVTRADIQ